MKKTLALVLALAMVFSTVTIAFAEGTIGADAQVCSDLGMLKGTNGTVDAAYVATAPTRIQAAVMFLRLKGLEAEALAFTGAANFADADKAAWAKPIMAYLKANPQLGWLGDGTNFNPTGEMTAQAYYKVMLESLGYKQTTPEVVGDFAYADVLTFAAGKGLSKVAAVTNYTVNDLAIATVEALKANMKEGGKTLVASLVEAGKVDNAKAVAAGLVAAAPVAAALPAVDTVTAVGNGVVEVVFEEDVDAATLGNVANYTIEGLAINAAVVAGTDTVRLETAAQTAGKLYTLAVGDEKIKFAGITKFTGVPAIDEVNSEDVEEVVITFTKAMDFATATDVANYTISGVEIVSAEVDGTDVTLTTKGLAARKQYTVKVKNVKSVDGVLLRSASESFYTKLDTTAPKFTTADGELAVSVETNQRIVVLFNEKVTKESAENIENYTIKTATGDTALEVISATLKTSDGATKERKVTLVTAPQTANKKYEISILNVSDKKKAANTIKKAIKDTFYGDKDDTKAPTFASATAIGRNLIKVVYNDDSKINPETVLDANAYTLKKSTPAEEYTVEKVEELTNVNGTYEALLTVEEMPTGSYNLKVSGLADEFGNVQDDKDKSFAVSVATYAAATVTEIRFEDKDEVATGKNITIKFDKDLNEESAEDIANYSIDGDIGTPISAEYDFPYVYLKTNELKAHTDYEITISGLTDLAGNVLDLSIDEQQGSGWDEERPEVDSAYSVNKYVVALAFDEAVNFVDDTTTLTLRPDGGAADGTDDIELIAKALKDDDTVVEFSDYGNEELEDNVTYEVYAISAGITDLDGNALDVSTDFTSFEVEGTNEEPERLAIATIEQRDGINFKVTFDGNLNKVTGTPDNGSFTKVDADLGDEIIVLKKTTGGKIKEADEKYEFDFSSWLTDEHGIPVLDDTEDDVLPEDDDAKTALYVEFEDDDSPYIVSVKAVDRFTVEIEYSDRIDSASFTDASYKIKNADADVSKTEYQGDVTVSAKTVTIDLTGVTTLQGIYDYELIINDATIDDLAGNHAEEDLNDTFSFDGTDLAPTGL